MKHRWIGVLLLAAAMTLGACAPTQQGTDEESEVTATMEATASAEPTAEETDEAAATSEPAPPDYDY